MRRIGHPSDPVLVFGVVLAFTSATLQRRSCIALLGSAASWPMPSLAQQTAIPVIGWLSSTSPNEYALSLAAFRQALSEKGWIDGQNVAIEYRWAEGHYDRLPALAAELVSHKVDVIPPAAALLRQARRRRPHARSRLYLSALPSLSRVDLSPA
jgi:ABC-type uncharacterized transport system substrate-binding protein